VIGHQVGCPLPVAVAADMAASLLNQGMGIWEVAPGPVALTQQVVGWFLRQAEFGGGADGIVTTGGSESNLTAVLAARARVLGPDVAERGLRQEDRPVILASTTAHYSIARAAGVAGIGRSNVVAVPVDGQFRLRPDALERAVAQAEADGRRIVCVSATAGTTSLGVFDPLEEIAAVCSRHGLWLHVDGAHGASLLLSERYRHLLAGVEKASSVTWDPHKMLFMPSTMGLLLVADGRDLAAVFDERPHYLFGGRAEDAPRWNFTRKNLRCTQRFDALKLWAALMLHGRRALAGLLDRTVELAHLLWERTAADPCFEPVIEPPCNIVCFRFVPPGASRDGEELDRLNEGIRTALLREGSAWLTTAAVRGRVCLRAAVMNPATTAGDLEEVLRLAKAAGQRLLRER
jgi:L-2,4-diaminobutyrate decarboxylase